MIDLIKVQAAPGRDILMEDGRSWPSGDVEVENTTYIRRRLADGDLIKVEVEIPSQERKEDKNQPVAKDGKEKGEK